MTPVRARRGRRIHAVDIGMRRDLAPEDIPALCCGRRLRTPIIVDEEITCPICIDIMENGN